MMFIKQDELLNMLSSNLTIINSRVLSFKIEYNESGLLCTIEFLLSPHRKGEVLCLSFKNIIEYSFAYSNDFSFYNVETYKFLIIEGNFYLSLNPSDDNLARSDEDEDYVFAEVVWGMIPT